MYKKLDSKGEKEQMQASQTEELATSRIKGQRRWRWDHPIRRAWGLVLPGRWKSWGSLRNSKQWIQFLPWDLLWGRAAVTRREINKSECFVLCNSLCCGYSHTVLGNSPNWTFGWSHCKPLRVIQEIPCSLWLYSKSTQPRKDTNYDALCRAKAVLCWW